MVDSTPACMQEPDLVSPTFHFSPEYLQLSIQPTTSHHYQHQHQQQQHDAIPTMVAVNKPQLDHILVTGATGFVGSAIARAIAEQHPECRITVLDRNPPDSTHELPSEVAFIQGDITIPSELHSALEQAKPQVVVHTAGIVPVLSERFGRRIQQLVWETNVEGTKNMLDAAGQAGVKGFIYTSTCCVVIDDMSMPYRNIDERWPTPESSLIYGESKVAPVSIYVIFQFVC